MKLSAIESELKAEIKSALALSDGQLANFSVAAPPPHIKADLSLAWPISAAKMLREPPSKIAEKVKQALAGKFSAEILPPGFVNIRLPDKVLLQAVSGIVSDAGYFTDSGQPDGPVAPGLRPRRHFGRFARPRNALPRI